MMVLAGRDVQESLAAGDVAVGVDHCGGCVEEVVVVVVEVNGWEE